MEKILPQDICLNINRLFISLSANKCVELSSNKTMNPSMCPIFVYGEQNTLLMCLFIALMMAYLQPFNQQFT